MTIVLGLAVALSSLGQFVRWWRIAQREHYIAGSVGVFRARWLYDSWLSISHLLVLLSAWLSPPVGGVLCLVTSVVLPWGLPMKGRTSPLVWTWRLRRVAVVSLVLYGGSIWLYAVQFHSHVVFAVVVATVLSHVVVDGALALLNPLENFFSRTYVRQAQSTLARLHPRIVGITGSYGKTSTKNHLAELVGHDLSLVASPKSFNNRAGLSRAINEHLTPGTSVFVAEMGTYGPGEISDLVSWCPPDIAIVTAIGPVHLERMKTLERVEEAKREITATASVVILNVDDARLMRWVPTLTAPGRRVVRAGTHDADVVVTPEGETWRVTLGGESWDVAAPEGAQPTNVACALAAALELGVPVAAAVARVSTLTVVAHRAQRVQAASGVWVIDDTFNANPASAAASFALLKSTGTGRRVVVTPGMIELGPEQDRANEDFARTVYRGGVELVIVGRTNKASLAKGFGATPVCVRQREDAVAWVRSHLHEGDAVLYLNDLPDQYP